MNGNMNLGKRVTALEKDGGADIKKEISDLQVAVATVQDAVVTAQSDIDALENKVNSGHVYSTEEAVCGTWINGKPVYQKTFIGAQINSSESVWVNNLDVTDLNIDNFLSVCGTLVYTDGKIFTINGGYLQLAYDPSTKFILATQRNLGSTLKWNVDFTIYYTKTTDNPTQ